MSVKRYRVSYDNGIIEEDGSPRRPADSVPMVNATDFDALASRLEEAERDAARYRWLRDLKCCSATVSLNDQHAPNYMTATEYLESSHGAEWHQDTDPAEIQRMKDTNTIWTIQVYPNTPVGFDYCNAASLDAAIDTFLKARP